MKFVVNVRLNLNLALIVLVLIIIFQRVFGDLNAAPASIQPGNASNTTVAVPQLYPSDAVWVAGFITFAGIILTLFLSFLFCQCQDYHEEELVRQIEIVAIERHRAKRKRRRRKRRELKKQVNEQPESK